MKTWKHTLRGITKCMSYGRFVAEWGNVAAAALPANIGANVAATVQTNTAQLARLIMTGVNPYYRAALATEWDALLKLSAKVLIERLLLLSKRLPVPSHIDSAPVTGENEDRLLAKISAMLKEQNKAKARANHAELSEHDHIAMAMTASPAPQQARVPVANSPFQAQSADPRGCFLCQDPSHIKRDCPQNKCHGCGRQGHTKNQCWSSRNGDAYPSGRPQPYSNRDGNRNPNAPRSGYDRPRRNDSSRDDSRRDDPQYAEWLREKQQKERQNAADTDRAQKEQLEALKRGNENLLTSLTEVKMRLDNMQKQRAGNANRA
jgi:hypothetical protein